VLNALEEQKIAYDKLNSELAQQEQLLKDLRGELAEEKVSLAARKQNILGKAKEEAESILRQARRETEGIISELKAQFAVKSSSARQTAIDKSRKRLRDNLELVQSSDEEDTSLMPLATLKILKPGTSVYVTTLKQKGIVLSINGSDVTVQLGIMKMNVRIGDCRLAAESKVGKEKIKKTSMDFSKIENISREIDIRGMMVDEAEIVLGKYIDDAILAGFSKVLVIHGKGTGALRKGVRNYLKHHHYVRDISIGELNEGGDGATVVQLK